MYYCIDIIVRSFMITYNDGSDDGEDDAAGAHHQHTRGLRLHAARRVSVLLY